MDAGGSMESRRVASRLRLRLCPRIACRAPDSCPQSACSSRHERRGRRVEDGGSVDRGAEDGQQRRTSRSEKKKKGKKKKNWAENNWFSG